MPVFIVTLITWLACCRFTSKIPCISYIDIIRKIGIASTYRIRWIPRMSFPTNTLRHSIFIPINIYTKFGRVIVVHIMCENYSNEFSWTTRRERYFIERSQTIMQTSCTQTAAYVCRWVTMQTDSALCSI